MRRLRGLLRLRGVAPRLLRPLGGPLTGFFRHLRRGGVQHHEYACHQSHCGQDGKHGLTDVCLAQLCQAAADHAAAVKGLPLCPQGGKGERFYRRGKNEVQQTAAQSRRQQGAEGWSCGLARPVQQQKQAAYQKHRRPQPVAIAKQAREGAAQQAQQHRLGVKIAHGHA